MKLLDIINEGKEKTLEEKIVDYIMGLYNGNKEDIVYKIPNAKSHNRFYPSNKESHYYIETSSIYPRGGNKLGLPANMGGMPYIKVHYVNSGQSRYAISGLNGPKRKTETLIIVSTKEALKPIMDKFNLDGSYIDKLKQIYVDTLSNISSFNELGNPVIWIDRTYTLLKGLKSSEDKFDFWLRFARENGLMDGYVEELNNAGKDI